MKKLHLHAAIMKERRICYEDSIEIIRVGHVEKNANNGNFKCDAGFVFRWRTF